MKRFSILTLLVLFAAFFATAQNYSRLLMLKKSRMNGEDVRAVQVALNNLGFTEVGEADGWFGPKTEKGVKAFQKLAGFSVNGVVNKDIYDLLVKEKGGNVMQAYLNELNQINYYPKLDLSKKTYEYNDHSAEGGEICVYKSDSESLYAEMNLCGEMGKYVATLYKVSGTNFVLVCESTTYKSHMNPDPKTDSVEYKIYYYNSGLYFNIVNGQAVDNTDNIKDLVQELKSRM